VLKKTAATGGLLIAVAAGALATCSPALAQSPSLVTNHNRNWNGTENSNYNHIRLRIHNRNNNIAVARTRRPERERERERGDMLRPPLIGAPIAVG
jgi:hypothetical protein